MKLEVFSLGPGRVRDGPVHLWPFVHTDHQPIMGRFYCITMPLNCSFMSLAVSSTVRRFDPPGAVIAAACESCEVHSELAHDNKACHDSEPSMTCSTETLRRQRIGLANKGKIPWNKGRKHSPETCARIKERTLEALKDPKIRKKMSETPRLHSEESKRKIGSSLKKLWAERLKRKRSKENFYVSWTESIAEAARCGGIDEEQLNWDSYERLKVEIAFRRLQWDEEKSKEKDMKRIRAEKKVQKRQQNITRAAQKKIVQKHNDELRAKKKRMRNSKRREEKEELAALKELNITDRLVKIFEKKPIEGPSCSQTGAMLYLQSALEKFDIDSIKAEQRRSAISLADQIQAAKSRRQQIVTNRSNITPSP